MSRTKLTKILSNATNVGNLSIFCPFKAMCNLSLMLLCVGAERWQEQHLLGARISFLILGGILCLHDYKHQAPCMLYKPAPGSTAWVLAAILLQNVTESLLGRCFRAWYFLLGWHLIQVFLALGYLSTPQPVLQCLCLAVPPVLCAHSRPITPHLGRDTGFSLGSCVWTGPLWVERNVLFLL